MMYLLYLFGQAYGWKALLAYYYVPYVVSVASAFSEHQFSLRPRSCATIGTRHFSPPESLLMISLGIAAPYTFRIGELEGAP